MGDLFWTVVATRVVLQEDVYSPPNDMVTRLIHLKECKMRDAETEAGSIISSRNPTILVCSRWLLSGFLRQGIR
jgi:hypothetical protein